MHVPVLDSPRAARRALARAGGALAFAAALVAGPREAVAQSGDGFLFAPPAASLTLRAGFDRASAGSDVFTESTRLFSLSRGAFSGLALGADLGIVVAPRLDVVLGAAVTGSTTPSHYRDLVASDDTEIEQRTTFRRIPLTAGVKAYLAPRGRRIGTLAWVPAKVVPYVGVGGGAMYYRFSQSGDFVDFQTNEVFAGDVRTTGWAPTAHGLAGVDYSLSPRIALTAEARYTWARGAAGQDFEGYDRVDLGGVAATAGLSFRF